MIDEVLRFENMAEAWRQVKANKGRPGIDEVTLARWGYRWEANIERVCHQVRTNTYRANRPKRFFVVKKDGGLRELARLTVTDKVLQRAVLNVLEPLCEPMFLDGSHGYRPKRSVATAVEQVLALRDAGFRWVLDADIQRCFDSLDHALIFQELQRITGDWFVLNLARLWMHAGRPGSAPVGLPLGAVISPFFCNLLLHRLDVGLASRGWYFVRYADDFLVFARSEEQAEAAWDDTADILHEIRLQLQEKKTRIASFEAGFTFLGVYFYQDTYSYTWQNQEVKVKGRKKKQLYRHLPVFYSGDWEREAASAGKTLKKERRSTR